MVANCSNVMNKARQPPPGVMPKGRAPSTSSLDAISPVQVRSFLLGCCAGRSAVMSDSRGLLQMDPLSGMGSLNLGGTAASHNQNMPGFPTSLSSAFSNPQSPAKAFPALSNPNPSTPFGGISSLSSQLSGMEPAAASRENIYRHGSLLLKLESSPRALTSAKQLHLHPKQQSGASAGCYHLLLSCYQPFLRIPFKSLHHFLGYFANNKQINSSRGRRQGSIQALLTLDSEAPGF